MLGVILLRLTTRPSCTSQDVATKARRAHAGGPEAGFEEPGEAAELLGAGDTKPAQDSGHLEAQYQAELARELRLAQGGAEEEDEAAAEAEPKLGSKAPKRAAEV